MVLFDMYWYTLFYLLEIYVYSYSNLASRIAIDIGGTDTFHQIIAKFYYMQSASQLSGGKIPGVF